MRVVVVNAWALHLGYLGCYGNEWVDTPQLDRLAAEGVVFDQHYADRLTAPEGEPGRGGGDAVRSAWTGRYRFPGPGGEDLATGGETDFHRFLELLGLTSDLRIGTGNHEGGRAQTHSLESTIREAVVGLDRLASQDRWLLWVDLPSLAPPWLVPEAFLDAYFPAEVEEGEEPLAPWLDPPPGPLDLADDTALERVQTTYAAVVSHFDEQIGVLREELERRGWFDQVLFAVTSERGLTLGEHGILGDYRPWLHDEVLHLPLLLRLPGDAEAGRRVAALTQPVDWLPTLLEAFGRPVPPDLHGLSLWPLVRGESEQVRAYACAGWRLGNEMEFALRTPEWGFLLPVSTARDEPARGPQVYVKPDDRWEVNNVLQHHLELADHLEQTLRGFLEAAARPGPLQAPELCDIEAELARAASAELAEPLDHEERDSSAE
jgi:arylsulfatase A-like enzyme